MIHALSSPAAAADKSAVPAMVIDVARSWRAARDSCQSTQPCLFATLSRYECGMLAPVFDGLMRVCEAALGRPVGVGHEGSLSKDEHLLLGLLSGSASPRGCVKGRSGMATALDCALCSTRIMMALALDQRVPLTAETVVPML